ncbi:hypothetical protein HFO42_16150 [Rhizobium leguminosarum]|uniref:Uncharacterized protein n=1 Tax=Rhizobium leguminosarum TaxID=384 RepID=A0AAJ1A9F2_RHILE|nr:MULTISPECIES: hypothetical protein [Rhizobium]MBY3122116.1 hypothetical protein [Rhizobium laguerreae]MBY3134820.1 hypothetical protein [Rhizobium laguerreae]MBY3154792.1 hypothetical protein [Rhizobium laguerreae]MBY3167652.1 hypothetical protein [Rhizobium laguerreae]MBY3189643.1 hypothetical protein [Rhizobium laguerreae]
MKSLNPVAGKTIVIIGEPGFLSDGVKRAWAARQAVVVTSSVDRVTMHSANETLSCDAAIIDVTIPDEAMLIMNEWLEARRVPFIFAQGHRTEALSAGFVLSDRAADINAIVEALFGSGAGYYH